MYAVEEVVREKAKNVTSNVTDEELARVASGVDRLIDGELGKTYHWPYGEDGTDLRTGDIPEQIIEVANFMTAGLLEQQVFAQNEAGTNIANPYGKSLERTGRQMLDAIVNGGAYVPELVGYGPVRHQAPQTQSYRPVSGFSGRSDSSSRRRC